MDYLANSLSIYYSIRSVASDQTAYWFSEAEPVVVISLKRLVENGEAIFSGQFSFLKEAFVGVYSIIVS